MANVSDQGLSIARLYSRSMLQIAEERGEADSLLEELNGLIDYLDRNPELERFLASPLVDEEDRADLLERAFRGKASDLLVDGLQIANRKGRLGLLRGIAEGYRIEHRELRGMIDAHVRTAVPLSEPLRAKVREAVARHTGKQPVLFEKVDPSLIGGIVIEVGGEKIDGSLARRIRELGANLERRATQEILRSRAAQETEQSEGHP
ncbi:MAG: ATP synthase F1 subunit delta [Thermoanaerobaculia bacterium]